MTPERVADYPRPPRLETSGDHVLVQVGGEVLFEGQGTQRVLETFHPPLVVVPELQTFEVQQLVVL